MTIQPIVLFKENPYVLRAKSKSVQPGVKEVQSLIEDLKDTLIHHTEAIGLAAPQIGVNKRVIAVYFGGRKENNTTQPLVIINPVIIESSRDLLDFDGCLSFPELYAKTVRPHYMRLQGVDERGDSKEWILDGFDSVVAHHETDHLNGVLLIDRINEAQQSHVPNP